MDFDFATKRLQREQQRSKLTTMKKKNMSMSTPQHHYNTKEMQLQQKQQRQQVEDQRQKERQQKQYEIQLLKTYMQKNDSKLGIQSLLLSSSSSSRPPFPSSTIMVPPSVSKQLPPPQHLSLRPISIHGNGDKITLPPSILERLLQIQQSSTQQQQEQQPWTFRLGIRNPKSLIHPISDELQKYVAENFRKDMNDPMDEDEGDDDEIDDDDESMEIDDDTNRSQNRHRKKKHFLNDMTFYMKEVQDHQYISYTHGTVIEFTQEEGYIGIPKSIAYSLLLSSQQQSSSTTTTTAAAINIIETTRSIDPATSEKSAQDDMKSDGAVIDNVGDDEEKTPGHVAYNAFDIPALPIEIILLQLPKGTGMTLRPIVNHNNNNSTTKSFYHLQQDQVKYALEQSIQRTRATITLHDIITTWYRGNEYQFLVTKLVAASSKTKTNDVTNSYSAVSCINTDIEIEFEPMNEAEENDHHTDIASTTAANTVNNTIKSTGRRLMDEPTVTTAQQQSTMTNIAPSISLPPEPPIEATTNIITIQFRFHSTEYNNNIQRRFDITTATIRDLFQFVQQQYSDRTSTFQNLVRRYPRRVFTYNDNDMTLQEASFQSGNELLIVEEV